MDARTDQVKYAFGCRTMENFIPLIYGGAERRPGLQYIAAQNSSSARGRVVAFEHSVDDTYILLFENQRLQFFRSGAPVYKPYGTEDLAAFDSGVGGNNSLIAHWKCADNAGDTTVTDGTIAGTHDGTASANTTSLTTSDAEGTANAAFDLDDTYYFTRGDNAAFSFGDGSSDSPFSIVAWVYYSNSADMQTIISKYTAAAQEWTIYVESGAIKVQIFDDSATAHFNAATANSTLTTGWHIIAVTSSGVVDTSTPTGGVGDGKEVGINVYIDWEQIPTTITGNDFTNYVAMENLGADIVIGAHSVNQDIWHEKIDNIAVFNKELSVAEIASLTGNDSTTVYSITTPYLTDDLPTLKFEPSADVMYVTHPDYEPRRLSRYAHTMWTLEASDIRTGPFLGENDDTTKTIKASATTGSVTLTASGCHPFISSAAAGHKPNGSTRTSKSQTGTLFKLVHAVGTPNLTAELDATTLNDDSSTLAVPKGISWDYTTNGTWGTAANPASVVLERSYDSGTTYETIVTATSAANKNITTSGTEESTDAIYKARVSEAGGAGTCSIQFSVRDTSHVGIVEITAVASSVSATAIVLKTLGSTNLTHRWSEGYFSNYRGWPIDVTISAEERLTFAGSKSHPLNIWGSESGNFTNFLIGTYDSDPMTHALVGTGQQNRIRWILAKDALFLGTVGGEHKFGASKDDEALTPKNKRAKVQTTYGSENIAALAVNKAILFVQRGGKRVRELLYDYESDSHKADNLTVYAEHIMGTDTTDGVVDMAYQRTPDPMLWCVRNDGQMAVMSYDRDQDVFAWSRFVTADSTSDSIIESVAVIYGGARSEDEVWCTVKRTINDSTARYVERFKPRNWGSDDEDAFFFDSGKTFTSGTATIAVTGATHLIGESVAIYADGEKQTNKTVSATGTFTLDTAASKVQYGLACTSTLKPMKPDIEGLGRATTKKITRGVISFYKTKGGEWGSNIDKLDPIIYRRAGVKTAEFPVFTGDIEMPFRSGYERSGDIIIRQADPYPMTVVALTLDVGVHAD